MLRIHRGIDGSYWIAREDKETEDYLDGLYVRLKNQLKWVNPVPSTLGIYKNTHQGQTAFIVGKGPSLDILNDSHLEGEGPVIGINEAVLVVEKLDRIVYGTQLDHTLLETCRPAKSTTKLFLGPRCANLYETGVHKYVVNPESWGLEDSCLSVLYAIMIARHMGCTNFQLLCFDGCLGWSNNYAKAIGYDSGVGGPKTRFKEHKVYIDSFIKGKFPLTWVTPTGPDTKQVTAAVS